MNVKMIIGQYDFMFICVLVISFICLCMWLSVVICPGCVSLWLAGLHVFVIINCLYYPMSVWDWYQW